MKTWNPSKCLRKFQILEIREKKFEDENLSKLIYKEVSVKGKLEVEKSCVMHNVKMSWKVVT